MPFALFENCQLCVSLAEEQLENLLIQIERSNQWADLIEIRLDRLRNLNAHAISEIKSRTSCPLIWTLRKKSQGGYYEGSEEERFRLLQTILFKTQPAFIDLEADIPESLFYAFRELFPHTKWIISWHDYEMTPNNLTALYQKVSRFPAHYYKIATMAHSLIDSIRMLKFTQQLNQYQSHVCGLCMGELGQITRILSPIVGQPFTFSCLETAKETAPGQLTAEELITTYRFYDINRETKIFGLIGNPVDKSASHLTHNAVFKDLFINAIYVKLKLEEKELSSFFQEIEGLPIKGLSVTMPFKEKILSLLSYPHYLSACNTLEWTSEGWKGYNTDGMGALKALNFSALKNQKIVLLGAGGTAKAIAQAAHHLGAKIAILNRTLEKAKNIALPLKAKWGKLEELPKFIQEGYQCIVQTTSVGMAPHVEEILVPIDWVAKDLLVLDVIANPRETRFLREVKKRGAKTISGEELFIHQAVEQFIYWLGPHIPQKRMEKIMRHVLITRNQQQKVVRIRKSVLSGEVTLPPSKSHTIRAILLGAFANGLSYIHHILKSPDVDCAIQAACQFGAKVDVTSTGLAIQGVGGYPLTPNNVIDAGNSGQVLRFVGALATLAHGYTVITGDDSIRSNRPIQPLIEGLNGLKAWAVSTRENGYAPFMVKGPLSIGKTSLSGEDSQPVSALLMAAAFNEGQTEIIVRKAGEKPWLQLTLSWLDRLGVSYTQHNLEHFIIQGKRIRPAFEVTIPGDLSSLAFPLAAALITQSEIVIRHVDLKDIQGDKVLVGLLQQMGACFEIDDRQALLKVLAKGKLEGKVVDVNDCIDAIPILAVLACFAAGETHLINGAIARKKESNRLACMTTELKKMGAHIEETEDGLKIRPAFLRGARVDSYGDHRIAMALIVAGLAAEGETEVQGFECISKSYPSFLQDLKNIGAKIEEETA